jgi:Nup53/35/40-type RNA recognition motif
LVYGFSFPEQVDEVIRRFECFGKVVGIRYNGKNWLAIRYESLLEVEKVLCQQPCLLSDGTLVGVAHMDKVLTQGLHFDAIPDFYRAQEFGICHLEEEKSGLMENDVLMSEKMESSRKLSFCEQLLAFIFGWDYSLEASN